MLLALVAQSVQTGRDRIECLVPAYRDKFRIFVATLFRIRALHRAGEPVRIIEDVGTEMAFGAKLPVGNRVVRRSIDCVHPPIGDVNVDSASCRTLMASVLDDLRRTCPRYRRGLGLGHRRDPRVSQRDTPCGHRAGGRRGLEEGSSIDFVERHVHISITVSKPMHRSQHHILLHINRRREKGKRLFHKRGTYSHLRFPPRRQPAAARIHRHTGYRRRLGTP